MPVRNPKKDPKMIKNRDIVVVNLTPWDYEFGNNCCNIALEMAKDNRVLYVNPPLDRITSIRDKKDPKIRKRLDILAGKQPALEEVVENLWTLYPQTLLESINKIPHARIFDWFNRRNNRKFAKAIQRAIAELGFSDYILFNDNDIFRSFHLKELLEPVYYLYYIRDKLTAVPYWARHGERIEPLHMAKADAIVANSTHLAAYGRQFNENAYYVGQGCDLSAWDEHLVQATPADMRTIPGPVIGYVGALNSHRLDINLIAHVAQARPDWSIVLVGPEDEAFQASRLHELRNVVFLGSKPPESLPAYVKAFDVCINPQAINPVTIGNYPRKIDEYLAMGKPTVATRTQAMEVFAEYTYLAEKPTDYVELIRLALEEDDASKQQARKKFAASHSWENNTLEIYKVMERIERGGPPEKKVGMNNPPNV
jgi:glycosyltransferase involved in cell wall biosynthesis